MKKDYNNDIKFFITSGEIKKEKRHLQKDVLYKTQGEDNYSDTISRIKIYGRNDFTIQNHCTWEMHTDVCGIQIRALAINGEYKQMMFKTYKFDLVSCEWVEKLSTNKLML